MMRQPLLAARPATVPVVRRVGILAVVGALTLGVLLVPARAAHADVRYYLLRNTHSILYLDTSSPDIGSTLVQRPLGSTPSGNGPGALSQWWGFVYQGMGYYSLRNGASDLCMTVDGNPPANGAIVRQRPCDTQLGQSWVLSRNPGSTVYEFRWSYDGPCLGVSNNSTGIEVTIVVSPCNGSGGQRWYLL